MCMVWWSTTCTCICQSLFKPVCKLVYSHIVNKIFNVHTRNFKYSMHQQYKCICCLHLSPAIGCWPVVGTAVLLGIVPPGGKVLEGWGWAGYPGGGGDCTGNDAMPWLSAETYCKWRNGVQWVMYINFGHVQIIKAIEQGNWDKCTCMLDEDYVLICSTSLLLGRGVSP